MEENNAKSTNTKSEIRPVGSAGNGSDFGTSNNGGDGQKVADATVGGDNLVDVGLGNSQGLQNGQGGQNLQTGQDNQSEQSEEIEQNYTQKAGQKVVSLKGVHTESELERQQRLDEMKKKAVALGKTEAEIKREQELEEMKKKAVSLKDGSQSIVNSVSDQSMSGSGVGGEPGKARTVITPDGRLVELGAGEELSGGQNVVNLKEGVEESGVDELSEKKDVKNVVDLGSAKSTPNPSFEKGGGLEEWEEQKVDLSTLSPEERINLQATPSLASVHWKMDDDLNGEVADWFNKYNKLPVNIKLGLGDRQVVQQAIKDLANKFGVMTEEGLGEISRIVRDVYVDLIGESEIKNRAINNLKIANDKIGDFLEGVAKIVSLVREVGNKKTDECFRKLSVEEILEKYPKLAEQEVTVGDIFDKKQQKYVVPTLKNWINDYINNAGSDKHTSLERAKYLEESHNTKYLEEDDRQAVDMLVKSYDTGSKLLVDSQDDVIYWRLHTDESELGINSDKSKRVINNFKIEEAQKVDVDREEQNREAENNLEKSGKSSIIEKEQKVAGNKKEDVLDLSTELENK